MLPRETLTALKLIGREQGATLFMSLLAAFEVLLHRYSAGRIRRGAASRGGLRSEVEGLIGLFVNTLALRCDLSGDPSFRELIDQVRRESLGAFAHQDLPFDQVIEALHVVRDPSRTPLFQVMFVLQNALVFPQSPALELSTRWTSVTETSKFDLTLFLIEKDGGLQAAMEYAADLFDPETIGHARPLSGVARRADRPIPTRLISAHSMLTAEERRRFLGMSGGGGDDTFDFEDDLEGLPADVSFDEGAPSMPRGPAKRASRPIEERAGRREDRSVAGPLRGSRCLHRLFERSRRRRSPDAVAVSFEGGGTSPDAASSTPGPTGSLRPAAALGVGPEVPVGLFVERSPDVVVGILGILKAGGAYVPLDPAYPADRLAMILDDARVPVLLTQRGLLDAIPAGAARVLCLDDPGEIDALPASPPSRRGARVPVEPRLYHLHLGLDRPPEGSRRDPRERLPALHLHAGLVLVRPGRRVVPFPLVRVRLLGLGDLGRPPLRRPVGGRPLLGEPLARGVPPPFARRGRHGAEPDPVGLPRAHRGRRGGRDELSSTSPCAW